MVHSIKCPRRPHQPNCLSPHKQFGHMSLLQHSGLQRLPIKESTASHAQCLCGLPRQWTANSSSLQKKKIKKYLPLIPLHIIYLSQNNTGPPARSAATACAALCSWKAHFKAGLISFWKTYTHTRPWFAFICSILQQEGMSCTFSFPEIFSRLNMTYFDALYFTVNLKQCCCLCLIIISSKCC